jgi:hypothetical protein
VDVRLIGGGLSNHGLGCWISDEVEGVSEARNLSLSMRQKRVKVDGG